ncbi:MAG TPA: alkaline phosphatase family protein [Roseiarcus sp.]|jgi:phospholipase C|nr:alkaline phosphatase family protein [Roseiarcus sp.]
MSPRLIAPLRLAAALFAAATAPSAAASAPKHLILIMMENHGTDTLLGNKEDAPFLTELVTQPGVRFATQYYGVTHPSLPNYLALIAGDEMGIHDDCKAGADIKCKPEEFVPDADESAEAGHLLTEQEERKAADMAHLFPRKTLIDQLDEAKVTWKVYMQGLPVDRRRSNTGRSTPTERSSPSFTPRSTIRSSISRISRAIPTAWRSFFPTTASPPISRAISQASPGCRRISVTTCTGFLRKAPP